MRTIVLAFFVLTCQTTLASENTQLVERFITAFNQRNIAAMLQLATENMRWMSVSGEQLSIETSSHVGLRAAMEDYFEGTPDARSEVRSINESGNFVYTLEEASWSSGGIENSQCSMAIYELTGTKIQNVWYFPSHECP